MDDAQNGAAILAHSPVSQEKYDYFCKKKSFKSPLKFKKIHTLFKAF